MDSLRHTAFLIGFALGLSLVLSGLAPRTELAEAACTASTFDPSALRGDAAEGDWLVYRNAKNGLSFRYPPSMRIEERDPATFGFDNVPDAIVDLRADGFPVRDFIVVRFICARGEKTPEMAAARARALRAAHPGKNESTTGSMEVDGHEAIVGCGCPGSGAASCNWGVTILQPRECSIFPMEPGQAFDDRLPPPHDGKFPLLSIINTVHFEPVPSNR
jgi:hypothetical protein